MSDQYLASTKESRPGDIDSGETIKAKIATDIRYAGLDGQRRLQYVEALRNDREAIWYGATRLALIITIASVLS